MSQPEGRALTLTELRHLYHPHLADEGSRERAVVVVDNSSHEDENQIDEDCIPSKRQKLEVVLNYKGMNRTSRVRDVSTVNNTGIGNSVQAQVREAENSLDSLRKLVQDYENASQTHAKELEMARKKIAELEDIRQTQRREIGHFEYIVAQNVREISNLNGILQECKYDLAKVRRSDNVKKAELDAAKEKLQKFEEFKEVMKKALGIDDASKMV